MKRFIALLLAVISIIGIIPVSSVTAMALSNNVHDILFDWEYYYASYPDLQRAFGRNPSALRNHWDRYGKGEGRACSALYNGKTYVALYPDLQRAFGNNYTAAYNHFVNNGINEGRQASSQFSVSVYKENYLDLRQAFGGNNLLYLKHYREYGANEKRNAVTKISQSANNSLTDVTKSFAGKTVTIKSVENGKYLSADGNLSNTPALCNRSSASAWETFTVSNITSDGWVGFKAYNGKWLCANANYSNTPLHATASSRQSWECFRIYQKGSDYYIKAQVNSKWLCVRVDKSNAPLQAYAGNPSTWERVNISVVSNNASTAKEETNEHSPVPAGCYFTRSSYDAGKNWTGHHDINVNVSTSTPVYAPFKGKAVFKQSYVTINGKHYLYSYGNQIEFYSEDGVYKIVMAHLDRFNGISATGLVPSSDSRQMSSGYAKEKGYARTTREVAVLKSVNAGTILGYIGTTGNSSGVHLHIEVYKNGSRVDPTTVFSGLTK